MGVITDPSGASVPYEQIAVTDKHTSVTRTVITGHTGDYSLFALPPGTYQVVCAAPGFRRISQVVIVEAGRATTVDFALEVGVASETVTVGAVFPKIRYDSYEVSGTVTPSQVETLPLNGRNFLELAKLEPGAQPPVRGSNNRTFVPLLGAPSGNNGRSTRVTVDGGSIMQIGNGGAAMGFSQDMVLEFQVSAANFDPSTGATASGAINVVTRSGGNDWHGRGFLFFRDHNLAAYPGLVRVSNNPHPFFQRRQFGMDLGGPLVKDRAFLFALFERNEQRGVIDSRLTSPQFAPLSRITPNSAYVNQFSVRTDVRLSSSHFAFLRHSHEGLSSFNTTTLTAAGDRAYPSAWTRQPAWTDQSILGMTSQLGSTLVNDFRFSYFFISSAEQPPRNSDCTGCLGLGAPSITVAPDLFIGSSISTVVLGRRFHINDVVALQKSRHRIRFGGDFEVSRGGRGDLQDHPVTMTLFSPAKVMEFNALPSTPAARRIPLPASFLTLPDILTLPVQSFAVGIGNLSVPLGNSGSTRVALLFHLFFHDTFRLNSRITASYGLGWTYDAPYNYDLSKPEYLASILNEEGLRSTRKNWRNFSPAAGLAWNPRADGKTVFRGGAGIYYDFQVPFPPADAEKVSLSPAGTGESSYAGAGIPNPLTGIPGVPVGSLLNFTQPTQFTGATLLQALPDIRRALQNLRDNSGNRASSVTNIEINKQGTIIAGTLPASSSAQASVGIQREIRPNFVVDAEFVFRRFSHFGTRLPGFDRNHYFSARGPVLARCTGVQRNDPAALCSLGPITEFGAVGHATYRGFLVRGEKRFSHGWQFLGSYALSSNLGHNFGNGFDNDNPLSSYGSLDRDIRHILTVSGAAQLPARFQLGWIFTYNSRPPFTAFLGGIDLNGDGTTGDLLPGTKVNQFNRGLNKNDLVRLIQNFNLYYSGKKDALGRNIPVITLPASFQLGNRPFLSDDLRLSREFAWRDRWRVTLIGEAFNLLNISNLTGASGDLLNPGFGQPTNRVTQVFGSGGPRSFQVAARIRF